MVVIMMKCYVFKLNSVLSFNQTHVFSLMIASVNFSLGSFRFLKFVLLSIPSYLEF